MFHATIIVTVECDSPEDLDEVTAAIIAQADETDGVRRCDNGWTPDVDTIIDANLPTHDYVSVITVDAS